MPKLKNKKTIINREQHRLTSVKSQEVQRTTTNYYKLPRTMIDKENIPIVKYNRLKNNKHARLYSPKNT
jgi:hypothetical protein